MAEFEVNVVKIDDVIEHPDADRLTIVKIGGYNCIANKKEDGSWRYQASDLVVYIPEQAVVPESLLKELNFWDEEKGKGILAGSKGDRVKAIKLRGIFSQGILMPVKQQMFGVGITDKYETRYFIRETEVEIGQDVSEILGIKKYEPPIPTQMAGQCWNASGMTLKFDIENIQKHNEIFEEDEEVFVTEKLHGTWTCMGISRQVGSDTWHKIVTSKGMSAKGLAFKDNEENESNLYMRMLKATEDENGNDVLERIMQMNGDSNDPVYLLGETFGRGVQDLAYGEMQPTFRGFDIYVGHPGQGRYMGPDEKKTMFEYLNIPMVPELYRGPFSMEKMEELRDGQDFSGSNIREGIVILPVEERRDDTIGRVQLKFVSPKYLMRKDGTEFN